MKLLIPAFATLTLFSPAFCAEEPATNDDVSVVAQDAAAMTGTYVGDFGGNKITVSIDRVIGSTVTGYSIVSGNERAFSGSFAPSETGFHITANEPGAHPADGVFKFTFVPGSDPKSIQGSWTPNDKKIGERNFTLIARGFKYDPKVGTYPQSSTKKLTEADVENHVSSELRIMRNEIYARHGYSFKLSDMRKHFDKQDWYMPVSTNISPKLTETEEANAALIKRYESYSEEFYDNFGR